MLLGYFVGLHKIVLYSVQVQKVEHDIDEALLVFVDLLQVLLFGFRRLVFFALGELDLVLYLSDDYLE